MPSDATLNHLMDLGISHGYCVHNPDSEVMRLTEDLMKAMMIHLGTITDVFILQGKYEPVMTDINYRTFSREQNIMLLKKLTEVAARAVGTRQHVVIAINLSHDQTPDEMKESRSVTLGVF